MCPAGMFTRWLLLKPVWFRLDLAKLALAALLMLSGAPESLALWHLDDRSLLAETLYCYPVAMSLWGSNLGSLQVRFPPLPGVFNTVLGSEEHRDLTSAVLQDWPLGVVVVPGQRPPHATWILTS